MAGPLGVVVKASTLRDYGVENFFFLENKNADTSQRNVVFVARGECGRHVTAIAGQYGFYTLYGSVPFAPADFLSGS